MSGNENIWGWAEAGLPGVYATTFIPDFGVQKLIFQTFDQAATGPAPSLGASKEFQISDISGGGMAGNWGIDKGRFVYIRRQAAGSFFLSEVDTSAGANVAAYTSRDILDVSAYTLYSSPRYLPRDSEHIGMIVAVGAGPRRHVVFNRLTGAIEADLPTNSFTNNPYETLQMFAAAYSPDGTKMAFAFTSSLGGYDRIQVFERGSGALLGTVYTGSINQQTEIQFSEDGTILFWVVGGTLNYLTSADWNTIITQPEVGVDSRGVARFWVWPRLSPDQRTWSNHWNYHEGGIGGTYYSRAHFLNADFTHRTELVVGGFATDFFKGDFDETGLWWAGGDYNINGNGISWLHDPWASEYFGGSRGSPFFMRPFQPF